MPLHVWSGAAHVVASLPGPGRVELFAVRPAGGRTPTLRVEAYGPGSLVVAGEVALWEINQAIAALVSESTQARRLSLRDDGRGHGGHLDVVADGLHADVVATSADGQRRVAFVTRADTFAADLSTLVRHYLTLARAPGAGHTIVLPEPAGAAAVSRAPAPR